MIREKVIAITLIIVSSIVLIESIAAWSTDHDLFLENSLRANRTLDGIIENKNSSPALLQANSWGEDIFYDRSNIYNSWFKLTGITQFEGGFKAIINGQITQARDSVLMDGCKCILAITLKGRTGILKFVIVVLKD